MSCVRLNTFVNVIFLAFKVPVSSDKVFRCVLNVFQVCKTMSFGETGHSFLFFRA